MVNIIDHLGKQPDVLMNCFAPIREVSACKSDMISNSARVLQLW